METIFTSHAAGKHKTRCKVIALTIAICPFFALSQENPWTYQQTENPWKTATKESKSTIVELSKIDTISIAVETDTAFIQEEQAVNEKPNPIAQSTEPNSNQDQTVRTISLYEIEGKAKDEYNAGVALALSIPAILFPPVTFPILIASVFVETPQQKLMIDQYKLDNPKASELEIKALKKGIRKKRAKRTAGGAGIGLGIVAAIIGVGIATY